MVAPHTSASLYRRNGDGIIVQIYWQPAPARLPGGVVTIAATYIEFDGGNYTPITTAQFEANYTPQGFGKKLNGR